MTFKTSLKNHVKSLKLLETKAESIYSELLGKLKEGEIKMRISEIYSDEKQHLDLLAEAEEILSQE